MKRKRYIRIFIVITVVALIIAGLIVANGLYQNRKLFDAIERDDYDGVKKAIEKGAWINTREELFYVPNLIPTNPTPLISACKKGNEKIITLLLENGADINKRDNYNGTTPLLAALHGAKSSRAKSNRFLLAMFLIENGADPFAVSPTDSPFEESILVLDSDNAQTIKEGFELFKYLMEQKVSMDICIGKENALTYAAHYSNYNVVEYLIEENYFDVDSKDSAGNTALIVATKNNETQIIQLLLQLGADKSIKDAEGKTAYDYAVELELVDFTEILKP